MTFSDIFKSSFLTNVTSVSLLDMVLALVLAFGVGLFVFFIYKKTYSGVMYSSSFGVTLILGMVGALSIVRFRTAIKEPMDIAFLFWSIAVGIVLGAGLIPLAVFGSVVIGIILLVFANHKDSSNPYIVVLSCEGNESEKAAAAYLAQQTNKCIVKSKTARKGSVELNMEVRLKDDNTDFINKLADLPGVQNAVLVSYNGDYMG